MVDEEAQQSKRGERASATAQQTLFLNSLVGSPMYMGCIGTLHMVQED